MELPAPPTSPEEKDRKDEPGEAMAFQLAKRALDGVKDVPFDRYLVAKEKVARMRPFDIASGRFSVSKKSALDRQLSLGQWKELGPFNIAGRARALVFDPRNPEVMYVGAAAGGVFKSTDAGQSWVAVGDLLPNMAVNALAIDPKNPDTLYAGTGEGYNNIDAVRGNGIFKTSDGGKTWTELSATRNNPAFFYVNKIVISAQDSSRLYAATGQGIFRSLNAGETWQRVLDRSSPNDGCADLVLRPAAEQDFLFAACGRFNLPSAIFRNKAAETDGEWELVLTDPGMSRSVIAISPSRPDTVYVLSAALEAGNFQYGLYALYRSEANGDKDSFVARVTNKSEVRMNTMLLSNQSGFFSDICSGGQQRFLNQGWYDIALAVDPVNPDRLWAGGIDLFRSDDAGANWGLASDWFVNTTDPTYAHADQHLIVFHPKYNGETNRTLYFLNDGGLGSTDDALAKPLSNDDFCDSFSSFRNKTLVKGMATTQFYHGLPYPGGAAWIGGKQDNGTSRGNRADGPSQWVEIQGGDGGYVAIAPEDPNRIYAETTRLSLRRSTNGVTFSSSIRGIAEPSGNFLFITPFRMDPNDSRRLYLGGRTLWRTVDGADNWTAFSAPIPTGSISAIAAAPGNRDRVVFGTNTGRFYRTNNANSENVIETWAQNFIRLNGNVSWIEFDPTNSDIIYATISTFNNASGEGHVFRSTDGGANWERRDGSGETGIPDIPAHSVAIDPTRPDHIYVGTDLGIFVSTDAGATWAKEDSGFVNTVVESMSIVRENGASTLTAFTHGRGVWQVHLGGESPSCQFKVSAPERVNAIGGQPRIKLETGDDCVWSVIPESTWTRATPASGKGSRELPLFVNINVSPTERQSKLSLADQTITVRQQGATVAAGNDKPANAFQVEALPFVGISNTRLGPSGAPEEAPLHSCTESRDSRHAWFRFTPDFSGRLFISAVQLSPANALQTFVLTLYEGEPVAANERICVRSTNQTFQEGTVEAGKTYFGQISSAGTAAAGGTAVLILDRVQ